MLRYERELRVGGWLKKADPQIQQRVVGVELWGIVLVSRIELGLCHLDAYDTNSETGKRRTLISQGRCTEGRLRDAAAWDIASASVSPDLSLVAITVKNFVPANEKGVAGGRPKFESFLIPAHHDISQQDTAMLASDAAGKSKRAQRDVKRSATRRQDGGQLSAYYQLRKPSRRGSEADDASKESASGGSATSGTPSATPDLAISPSELSLMKPGLPVVQFTAHASTLVSANLVPPPPPPPTPPGRSGAPAAQPSAPQQKKAQQRGFFGMGKVKGGVPASPVEAPTPATGFEQHRKVPAGSATVNHKHLFFFAVNQQMIDLYSTESVEERVFYIKKKTHRGGGAGSSSSASDLRLKDFTVKSTMKSQPVLLREIAGPHHWYSYCPAVSAIYVVTDVKNDPPAAPPATPPPAPQQGGRQQAQPAAQQDDLFSSAPPVGASRRASRRNSGTARSLGMTKGAVRNSTGGVSAAQHSGNDASGGSGSGFFSRHSYLLSAFALESDAAERTVAFASHLSKLRNTILAAHTPGGSRLSLNALQRRAGDECVQHFVDGEGLHGKVELGTQHRIPAFLVDRTHDALLRYALASEQLVQAACAAHANGGGAAQQGHGPATPSSGRDTLLLQPPPEQAGSGRHSPGAGGGGLWDVIQEFETTRQKSDYFAVAAELIPLFSAKSAPGVAGVGGATPTHSDSQHDAQRRYVFVQQFISAHTGVSTSLDESGDHHPAAGYRVATSTTLYLDFYCLHSKATFSLRIPQKPQDVPFEKRRAFIKHIEDGLLYVYSPGFCSIIVDMGKYKGVACPVAVFDVEETPPADLDRVSVLEACFTADPAEATSLWGSDLEGPQEHHQDPQATPQEGAAEAPAHPSTSTQRRRVVHTRRCITSRSAGEVRGAYFRMAPKPPPFCRVSLGGLRGIATTYSPLQPHASFRAASEIQGAEGNGAGVPNGSANFGSSFSLPHDGRANHASATPCQSRSEASPAVKMSDAMHAIVALSRPGKRPSRNSSPRNSLAPNLDVFGGGDAGWDTRGPHHHHPQQRSSTAGSFADFASEAAAAGVGRNPHPGRRRIFTSGGNRSESSQSLLRRGGGGGGRRSRSSSPSRDGGGSSSPGGGGGGAAAAQQQRQPVVVMTPELHSSLLRSQHARVPLSHAATPAGDLLIDARSCDFFSLSFVVEGLIQWAVQPPLSLLPCDAAGGSGGGGSGGGGAAPLPPRQQRWWLPEAEGGCRPNPFAAEAIRNRDEKLLEHIMHMLISHTGGEASSGSGGAAASASSPPKCFQLLTQLLLSGVPRRVTPGVIKEAILGLSHHRLRQAIRDLLRDAVRGSVPGGPATPAFPPLPVPQAQQHHSVRGFSASAGGAMSPMLHSAPPGSRGSSAAPSSSIGNSTAAAAGGGGGIFYPGGSSTTPGGFSSMPSSPGSGFPTFSLPAFGGGGGGVGWGGPASSREGSVPHTVSSFGGGTFASDSVIGKGCASAVVTQLRRSQGSGVPGESVGRRQTPTNPSFSFPGPPTPHASHGVVRKAKPRGAAAKLTAEDSEPRPLSQGALFFLYEMAGRLVPHSLVSAVSTLDRWGLQRGPHRAQPPLSDTAGGGGGSSGGSPGSCCHHHHHHHASPECCSGGSPDGSTASGVVSSWVDWTTPSPGGAAGGGVGGAENIPGCPAPSPVEYGVGDAGVEPHAPSHSCRQGGLQSLASGISVADRQKGAMHGGSPPSPGIQPPSQAPKFTGVHMEILPQQQRGGGQASSGIHSDPAGACCALLPASISGVDPFIGKRMSLGGSDIAQNRGGGPLFIPASVADGQPGLLGESSCLEIFSFFDAPKLLRGDSSAGGVWDASTPQGKSDLLREVCRAVGSSHLFGFPPSGEGNATSAPECAEAWAVRERSICEHRQFYQGLQSLGERSLAAHLMEMLASGGGDSAPQHASGSTASPSTSPSDQPLPMGAASRRRSSGSLRVSTQPPTPSPRSTGTPVSQGMSFTAQLAQAYGGVSPLVEPADKPSSESGGGSSRQEEKAGCASRGGGGAAPIMSQQRATVLASHYQGALEGVSSEMFAAISSAVLQEGGSGAAPTADLQFEALQSLAIAVEDLGIPHIAGFSEALACCAYSVLPLRSFFFMIQRGAFAISDRLALYIAEREVLKLAMDPDGTASGGSPRRQHRLRGTRRRRHTTKTLQYVTQLAMCASSSGMQIRILRAVQWCQSVLDAEAGGVVGGGGGGVGVGVGGEAPPHTTPAAGSTVEATPNASSSSASAQREAAASSAGGAERGITPVAEQRQPEGAKGRPPLPPAHLGLYEAGGEAAGAAAGDGAADAVGSSSASPQGLSGGSVNTAGRASPAPSEDAGFERVGSLRIQRVPSWESTFLESVEQSSATRRTKGAAWGSSAASPPSSPHHRSDLSDSQRVAPGQPGEVALDLSIRKVDSGVVSALPHTPVRSRGEEEEGDGGGSSGGGSFGGVATFPMEPGQHRGLARRVSDAGIAFAMHGPFCEDHSWWGDANIAQDIESFVLQSCSKEVYDTGLWGRGCASAASRYKKSVVLQSEEPSQSSRKSQQHAATAPAGMPPVGTSLSPSPQRGGSVLTDLMKDMESPDMHPTVGKSSGFVPLDLLRESWKSLDTTATLYLERQSIAAVSHGFGPLLAM